MKNSIQIMPDPLINGIPILFANTLYLRQKTTLFRPATLSLFAGALYIR